MALEFDFVAGVDPTSLSEITGAQLKQLVDAAVPVSDKGLIIAQTDTPDVANNPRYAAFLWLDLNGILADGNAPYTLKYYNAATPAWEPVNLGLVSIDGANIISSSIDPVDALDATGLDDGLILVTNAEAWALSTLIDAIANGSITLGKLQAGTTDKDVMMWNGSAWAITQISYTDISVADGQIPTEKLEQAISSSYLLAPDSADGLKTKWFPITDVITRNFILYPFASEPFPWTYIAKAGANQIPVMDPGGNVWTFLNKSEFEQVFSTIEEYEITIDDLVSTHSSNYQALHTLGTVPTVAEIRLKCIDAANRFGYDVDDEFSILAYRDGGNYYPIITYTVNTTSFNITLYAQSGAGSEMREKSVYNYKAIVPNDTLHFSIVLRLIKFLTA